MHKSDNKKLDALIIFYEGYLSVSPTICNIADYLVEKGWDVEIHVSDIYTVSQYPKYSPTKGIKVISHKLQVPLFYKLLYRIARAFKIKKYLSSDKYGRIEFFAECIKRTSKKEYDCVIAVDPVGLIALEKIYTRGKKNLYLSLEIYESNSSDYCVSKLKEIEFRVQNRIGKTIIQDEFRKNCLRKINRLPDSHIFYYLPNSPRGFSPQMRGGFFNEKFNIEKNTPILLATGCICDEFCSLQFAEQSCNSEKVAFILHEREKRDPKSDLYLKKISDLQTENLYLSLDPVPASLIENIFTSCDVGAVFYNKEYGANIENIIGASGKLSQFLKYGKPIIANDLPGFAELFEKYHCGKIVKNFNEIVAAVHEIMSDYFTYSSNAKKCYAEEYEFDKSFNIIYKKEINQG